MTEQYENQVRLLLRVLPIISEIDFFALKGGTAINFFWRDFPRLSVDIDLTYLPVKGRKESLRDIKNGIQRIAQKVSERLHETTITTHKSGGTLSKLIIRDANTQIKIEVNTVLRGTLFEPIEKELNQKLQEQFELYAVVKTLSLEDLYGGKICAALDRQHPRDLFDVKLLLENEGITENIRIAFVGYLISHSRPVNELLNPNTINIEEIYKNEFDGMTIEQVDLEELTNVQKRLPGLLLNGLTDEEKEFLITFKKGNPNWDLTPVDHLKDLPAIQWKLLNIKKMNEAKHQEMLSKLEKVLDSGN